MRQNSLSRSGFDTLGNKLVRSVISWWQIIHFGAVALVIALSCNNLFNTELAKDDRQNRVVIHSLRHTFASHLAINGTPIYTIQKLMNHKDINMTLRYAKLSPDSGRDYVDKLYA